MVVRWRITRRIICCMYTNACKLFASGQKDLCLLLFDLQLPTTAATMMISPPLLCLFISPRVVVSFVAAVQQPVAEKKQKFFFAFLSQNQIRKLKQAKKKAKKGERCNKILFTLSFARFSVYNIHTRTWVADTFSLTGTQKIRKLSHMIVRRNIIDRYRLHWCPQIGSVKSLMWQIGFIYRLCIFWLLHLLNASFILFQPGKEKSRFSVRDSISFFLRRRSF